MLLKCLKMFITLAAVFSITGCGLVLIGFENVGRTVFSSPEKARIKINNPVKPNVKLSAYRIGHSSTLLQIYDKVILLDPVFNDVVSGVMLRQKSAAINLDSLSQLDMILISHAHMDHLSISTLSELEDKFAGAKLVFPKGAEEFMPNYNFDFIRMKTGNSAGKNYIGETKIIDSVEITTVYALHFGGRFGLDSYLWKMPGCTGYIIQYKDVTVFYAGDTLYDDKAYKSIGEKFKIDLAIIPIGPCKDCEEVNNFTHVTSYGALLMFDDLKAEYMIPVHYGAFTYRRGPDYPLTVLKELIAKRDIFILQAGGKNLYYERVKILDDGEQYIFN